MQSFYLTYDNTGRVTGTGATNDGTIPPNAIVCTPAQLAAWQRSTVSGGVITAQPPPPPSLAMQAVMALAAGLTISSAASPALNGVYACDDAAQGRINRVFSLIQRAGGNAFPAGLAAMPWPDINGVNHVFTSVADFLAFETAIGEYVMQLELIAASNSGALPSSTVDIP